jgi:alkylation response protein AidB-like acyl-CoA dehydrogenase
MAQRQAACAAAQPEDDDTMISFELSEEQAIAQASIREFSREQLAPAARRTDERASLSGEVLDAVWSLGIVQARLDASNTQAAIMNCLVLEELGRGDASVAVALAATLGYAAAIADQGSAAQKKRCADLIDRDSFVHAAVLLAEPVAAFSASQLSTRARSCPQGYVLNGRKSFVPIGSRCEHFLVIAELDGRQEAFLVDGDAEGVSRPVSHATLGLRAAQVGEVSFENVLVAHADRMGEAAGCDVGRIIDASRTAVAAILTGISASVLDYVIPYTKERIAHGEPLAKKQTIAFRIADMHMKTEAMRWMHWRAARSLDRDEDTLRRCRLAQLYAGQHAMWIADEGVQMLGGHGFTRDYPVEMWYRDARTLSLLDGVVGL